MADESDTETGIVEHTNGQKFTWYGTGESKIVANADFVMTYGVKNDITLGVSNGFTAAVKSEISIGATLAAGLSTEFGFKHEHEMTESKGKSVHTLDKQVLTVGGDIAHNTMTKTVRIAALVLILAQAGILATGAAATIYQATKDQEERQKQQDDANAKADDANAQLAAAKKELENASTPEEKEQAETNMKAALKAAADAKEAVDEADQNVAAHELTYSQTMQGNIPGYVFSAITLCLNAITVLGVITHILYQKFKKIQYGNAPTAVLSLDKLPAAFLGIRPPTGIGAMGLAMNNAGLSLTASDQNLQYAKVPGADTQTNFDQTPDAYTTSGARIRLNASGPIETWGSDQYTYLGGANCLYAVAHQLQVTGVGGAPTPDNWLKLGAQGTSIRADQNTLLTVDTDNGISAQKNNSFLSLTSNSASVGQGGNTIDIQGDQIEITFGGNTIKMDAAGVHLGDGIDIISPTAPTGVSSTLTTLKTNLLNLTTAQTQDQAEVKLQATKLQALNDAMQTMNEALLETRAMVESATEAATPT
ncbi:hypothetical protein [Castellaniella sp.]|uniref:hypothetical protein n=1 Tax=Castellaniella sp. TaxID=1955812 RepID=UPI002AFF7476|nr:hypothetical protein [Castellaniella sp.]